MKMKKVKKRRWAMASLIALGVIVNYFDRINMSVGIKPLSEEFDLTPGQLGILLSAFAWSYAILQIPAGVILDKIGVKWVTRVGTIIWTVACFLTAIASGQGLVILSRVLLGVGEAPYFPSAAKAVGQWFPRHERSTAISLYDAQSKLSNAIGTPIIAWIITEWGWRAGFYATALLSLIYAIIFWATYRDPHEDKQLSKEEYDYIVQGGAQKSDETAGNVWETIRYLLTKKKVWATLIGFAAYGYSWFLFLTWLPGYLATEMHMSILKSGWYASIPWIVGTISEIVIGGWLIDRLVNKGGNSTRVRKTFLVIGMLLGLSVIGAAFTTNPNIAILCISIALGGLVITSSIAYSIPTFIAPQGTVGTLTGLLTFGNNSMAIVAPIITGFIVQATGSFMYAFLVAALILLAGIFSYVFLLTDLEPIEPMVKPEAASNANARHVKTR
ncbi:MFS transporter [Geobacillus subterraneus]|uniref:MFS transporter n=1 Tax=Geobacillus subterraneus TaxID=129338 RepID=UPI001442BA47|nr:MFS transporter [Geobacillus subterraneus]QIZ68029.1 MFS transporter [Geobacillus subterraneus]WPZ17035.1 MFS transporter [Geobacillus subterraneus]